jgi:Fe-S oxidoreductase
MGGEYSPRKHVLAANAGETGAAATDGALFSCLTCSLCDWRCPAQVAYTDLIRGLREGARKEGAEPDCPHGGALQSVMRIMARGGAPQDRLKWLDKKELKTEPEKGEVFYWTGCTMYFDALFPEFEVTTLDGTRAAIRLLNEVGITPVVSLEERCCGHDLIWNGDRAGFEMLARHNVKLVADSGAKTLIVSCAECIRTWKLDYAPFFQGKQPKIVHIAEFLEERIPEMKFRENGPINVTYQDPCRLGRHLGVYDPPRKVLEALPGVSVVEMKRSGPGAICCAGGTWSNCDRYAKKIQVDRLGEARATGADVIATACPKCRIHFHCAMKDPNIGEEIKIQMRDLAELVADSLA